MMQISHIHPFDDTIRDSPLKTHFFSIKISIPMFPNFIQTIDTIYYPDKPDLPKYIQETEEFDYYMHYIHDNDPTPLKPDNYEVIKFNYNELLSETTKKLILDQYILAQTKITPETIELNKQIEIYKARKYCRKNWGYYPH